MARPKLPEAKPISFKLQPLFHRDIIDFIEAIPENERSDYYRAALRIIRDNPQLLRKYLNEPPQPPQMSINDLIKSKTG